MRALIRHDSWLMKICSMITNIMLLNLLFIISCLPLVTIGAAIVSSLNVGMKLVRQEECAVVKTYGQSFRHNFKQSTLMFSLVVASTALLIVDLMVIAQVSGFLKILLSIGVVVFSLILSSIVVFAFGYLSRYEVSLKRLCLNSIYLALRYPIYSLSLLLLNGFVAVSILSSPLGLLTGIYVLTFGGAGLLAVVNSWFLLQVFTQLEKQSVTVK